MSPVLRCATTGNNRGLSGGALENFWACLRESYNGATTGNPLKEHATGHNNRVTQNVGHMSFEGLLGICMHKAIGFEYFKFIFENFVFF